MKNCPQCGVNIYSNHTRCPLCGHALGEAQPAPVEYPKIAPHPTHRPFLLRLLLFLSVAAALICGFINIFTWQTASMPWSIIVACSGFYVSLLCALFSTPHITPGRKILFSVLATAFLLLVIDLCSGFYQWAGTYVIPFLTIAAGLLFILLAIRSKKSFLEYTGCLLAVFFLSLLPILFYVCGLSNQLWSSLVATLSCLVIVSGMLIFASRTVKEEFKKRFHL